MTYGHHSCITTDVKVLAFENKSLRRILGIKWQQHITNNAIREVVGLPSVNDVVSLSRWRWMEHIFRSESESV